MQRGEEAVGDLALGVARREDRDLGAAGDFRERGRHQHGGNERHLPAGHVEADTADGVEFFPDEGAVLVLGRPVFREAPAVEFDDAVAGGLERPDLGGGETFRGGGEVGGFDREIAGAELGTVELGGVIPHGLIPAHAHIGEDGGDGIGDLLRHDRPAAKGGQIIGKGLGSVMERAHGKTL